MKGREKSIYDGSRISEYLRIRGSAASQQSHKSIYLPFNGSFVRNLCPVGQRLDYTPINRYLTVNGQSAIVLSLLFGEQAQ